MRLLHVIHQYPPEHWGGTEVCTRALAAEQARRGHEVSVFTRGFGASPGTERDGDVAVWRAPGGTTEAIPRFVHGLLDGATVDVFGMLLDEVRPALVHIQHLMGLPVGMLAHMRRRGIPFVLSLHDYYWFCPNAQLLRNGDGSLCAGPTASGCGRCGLARGGTGGGSLPLAALGMAWRRRTMHRAAEGASAAIAPSRFVLDAYVAAGFRFARAEVAPHGIELTATHAAERAAAGAPLRLAYVGGLSPQKGLHVVLDALAGLPPGIVSLDVVGGVASGAADYAEGLTRRAATLPVRLHGPQPHERALAILAGCDALVMPSVWHETFGMVISEAFALGKPVLASRIGALTERVRDDVDGLLLPPGDVAAWREAIAGLAADRTRLERLSAGVRPPVSLADHAEAVESIYRDCLAGRATWA